MTRFHAPLSPRLATDDTFAPFGALIADAGQPGRTYIDVATQGLSDGVKQRLWTIHRDPAPGDVQLTELERHPLSPQSFMPLGNATLLVAVATSLPDGSPDPAGLSLFVVPPGCGVCYRRGVWHHGLITLDAPCGFAVLMGCVSAAEDTETHPLDVPVTIPRDILKV